VGGLEGRVALVSGGSRGIGRAIALALAADGAVVAVNYRRDETAATETVAAIVATGGRAIACRASVEAWGECEALVAAVVDELGPVDILVHSAGIASRGHSVVKTDPEEVERLFRVRAMGAFHLAKLCIPAMRERPRGDIVLLSSSAVLYMGAGSGPYTMAKAAEEALAHTLAKEERRHGIHVNIVAPGLVETEMGRRLVKGALGVDDIRTLDERSPFGHVCTPDEVADVVRFLVSDAARYVNDQRIGVEGGAFPG
jgi:NAD(P)-dependent dehydrogenase (short-subunit alcohol dehydrogenase family)